MATKMARKASKPATAEQPMDLQARAASKGNPAEAFVSFSADEPLSRRPMIGKDVNNFRARHALSLVDVIYALAIQNSAIYNKVVRKERLPFTMELLVRLYDKDPQHAPWGEISPEEAFRRLYGGVLEQFKGTVYEGEVKLSLYRRFSAAFGRSVFTAYRWIRSGGNSKAAISRLLGKLFQSEDPRRTLEDLARLMYKVRGVDFDREWPLPTLENPPTPKRRGPAPKNPPSGENAPRRIPQAASRGTATRSPAKKSASTQGVVAAPQKKAAKTAVKRTTSKAAARKMAAAT